MAIVWLVAAVFFCILEGATVGLTSIWFVGGALGAFILALLHANVWVQLVVFVGLSCGLLAALRPLARKYLITKKTPTNADRNIGSNAIVTEEIDNLKGTGAVKISGVEWTARSSADQVHAVGEVVVIDRIEGVKMLVSPVMQAAGSK